MLILALMLQECCAALTLSSPRSSMAVAVGGAITYFAGGGSPYALQAAPLDSIVILIQ